MKEPLVSVRMLTYNHAPYIVEAIEGVLSQKTDFSYELLIGEDCSTDGTREIVFDYQKRYPDIIRVITSDQNVGMSKNSLRMDGACRGKYVAWCEGDDYWHHPLKIQRQTEYLESHPECALICSDYDRLYATGKRITNFNRRQGKNPSLIKDVKYIIRGTPSSGILTCTAMAPRDLVVQARTTNNRIFQGREQPCGDTPSWTALYTYGHIAYIDESLATYRQIAVSATQNPSRAKVLRKSIAMKEQMLTLIDHYGLPPSERALHELDLWKRRLRLAFYERNAELAVEAKKNLPFLTPQEWIYFFGARSPLLQRTCKPLLNVCCRNLIPKVKKP